jgi:hypothetical protein
MRQASGTSWVWTDAEYQHLVEERVATEDYLDSDGNPY